MYTSAAIYIPSCIHVIYLLDSNRLIEKIDARIQKKNKTSSKKKRRVIGSLRHQNAPSGLPKWMIKPSTRTEQHSELLLCLLCMHNHNLQQAPLTVLVCTWRQ